MAPNATPKLHATMIVVTIVVKLNSRENNSPMLGRLKVPAAFFAAHFGDSGRNGRIIISGIAGTMPLINAWRPSGHGCVDHLGTTLRMVRDGIPQLG